MAIRVSENLFEVHALLARYDIPIEWLEIVESVQSWCVRNGIPENNPFRAAKCFAWEDRCHIVIKDHQTDAMISSAKQLMELNGFGDQIKLVADDRRYLYHLLLHEIACFKLQDDAQDPRDEWAFNELSSSNA